MVRAMLVEAMIGGAMNLGPTTVGAIRKSRLMVTGQRPCSGSPDLREVSSQLLKPTLAQWCASVSDAGTSLSQYRAGITYLRTEIKSCKVAPGSIPAEGPARSPVFARPKQTDRTTFIGTSEANNAETTGFVGREAAGN